MKSIRKKRVRPPLPEFRPYRNAPCLCGSGEKFKRCCSDTYNLERPGNAAYVAYNANQYDRALTQIRADITRYTIWHKSHTEPYIHTGEKVINDILEIDILALSEMVDFLCHCYLKVGISDEFPVTLERLRANIKDQRWQRKIVYFHALHACGANRNEEHGRRELTKLGSVKEETDVEILQLYIDIFARQLSFSDKQQLINQVIKLSQTAVDKLAYRSLNAVNYLMVGDENKAISELHDAIRDFRESTKGRALNTYDKHRLALSLQLFGSLQSNDEIIKESIELFTSILNGKDTLTASGKALTYKLIGDSLRNQEKWEPAAEMYKSASALESDSIFQIFLSECLFHLGKVEEAKLIINSINPENLGEGEGADYVFKFAAISAGSADHDMLNQAEVLLRKLDIREPYFRRVRDSLLLAVLETRNSGKSTPILERVKITLRQLRKYIILQPNIMGIGLDVGKILDRWTKGSERHLTIERDRRSNQ